MTSSSNNDLVSELCEVWNARLRVRILAPSLRELGKYGPMKKVVSGTRGFLSELREILLALRMAADPAYPFLVASPCRRNRG